MISASIVLYLTKISDLQKIITCLLKSEIKIKIFLIDNSPTDMLKQVVKDDFIEYFHNPSNPGFGAAHNIAIKKSIKAGINYHLVINPDIYFEEDIITPMLNYVKSDSSIGMIMPQILNLDGSIQHLPKLLPSPLSILIRKIKWPKKQYSKFIAQYELSYVHYDVIYNAPILSGCFTLLNLKAVQEVGVYDDKFFMYFEDWDLSRRMHKKYKTIYFPHVSVYHGYESGANKSGKLFKIFIKSAILYFDKWGWFSDSERNQVNKDVLAQFNT